jgi:NAD-dependent dihydropyrimidine dehydrogenase PreA subunit/biotin operon repressor
MGHIVNPDRKYRLLQQRLDHNVTGAPESPTFMKILRLLFSPEEAELARRLPGQPTSLDVLSRKLGIPQAALGDKMTEMAQRGLVVDFEHDGQRYFSLPPVAIGFFEFTFMRARDDLPMAELAHLFEEYMLEDDRFARSVFQGQTQLGRSLVREEALSEEDHTEILDWERASHIVRSASAVGVSLCACRHLANHLGRACDRPQQTCLSLNYAAEMLIRCGLAQPITTDQAMRILGECKEIGLAQTGDNVQRKVTYICNCCGCCCGMIEAIKTFDIRNAIVTSNWIMEVDLSRCKGCGSCARVCPVEAIEITQEREGGRKRKWAVRDETLCLGCGVCYSACKNGGITMKPRAQRVFTPETIFDRIVSMAIERGRLADLIFEDPERLSHRALGRIVGVLEKSPPFKAAMAIEPLRSAFLSATVRGAKRRLREIGEVIG